MRIQRYKLHMEDYESYTVEYSFNNDIDSMPTDSNDNL